MDTLVTSPRLTSLTVMWLPWSDVRSCSMMCLQIKHILSCLRVVLLEAWVRGRGGQERLC